MRQERKQGLTGLETDVAVLRTLIEGMAGDIGEIKSGIAKINGGLRGTQNDVTEIRTNCQNCTNQVDDLRKRMNVYSTVAAVGGGILGYLGSYFK